MLESLPADSDRTWDALGGGDNLAPPVESSDAHHQTSAVSDTQTYHSVVLQPGLPTLVVHYIWCTDGHFELVHYLTVLSVIHQLQPDKIVIHYRKEPRTDPQGYWRWLEDLQRSVAMLSMRPLSNFLLCSHDLSSGVTPDQHDVQDPYGVFLLGDVAVSSLTRSDVKDLITRSFSERKSSHLRMVAPATEKELSKSQIFLIPDSEPYRISQVPGRVVISCPSVLSVNSLKEFVNVTCINMNTYMIPDDLFTRDNSFYSFARSILYGSSNVISTDLAPTEQIPNIVHIILTDDAGEITPLQYVSIKSAYVRGRVDRVYIHGTEPPKGQLWRRLVMQDEIIAKYIPMPSSQQLNTKHSALVYALYTLLQHGGLAHFGDVVFLHPITSAARQAGALVTPHVSQYRLKHPSTNTAILAGSKGSTFIESLLAHLRQEDLIWPDTRADDVAAHVIETNPQSVLLDSKLTSHQKCDSMRCQVQGGHFHPKQTYTTRLMWQKQQPKTLDQLLLVEGPTKSDIKEIIDLSHFIHSNKTSHL